VVFIAYQYDCSRSSVFVFLALLRLAYSANRRNQAAKALMPERMVRAIMSKGIRLGEILKPTG